MCQGCRVITSCKSIMPCQSYKREGSPDSMRGKDKVTATIRLISHRRPSCGSTLICTSRERLKQVSLYDMQCPFACYCAEKIPTGADQHDYDRVGRFQLPSINSRRLCTSLKLSRSVFAAHQIVRHRQQCMTAGLLCKSATSHNYGEVDSYMLHSALSAGPHASISTGLQKQLHFC